MDDNWHVALRLVPRWLVTHRAPDFLRRLWLGLGVPSEGHHPLDEQANRLAFWPPIQLRYPGEERTGKQHIDVAFVLKVSVQ